MAQDVEFLKTENRVGKPMLEALFDAAAKSGDRPFWSDAYSGHARCLVLYGVGAEPATSTRSRHVINGGTAILWDVGYFGRPRGKFLRVSINDDHPQHFLDRGPSDASRWQQQGLALQEVADERGHVLLIGIGPKTHAYLGGRVAGWEGAKLRDLRIRFPNNEIVFRPKPRRPYQSLPCRTDAFSPISELLRGAALVVCRHSNVAVDAAIHGVPFECEDGAARWLLQRDFTPANRLKFLRRLAWWQWRADEAPMAWNFLNGVMT